MTDADNGDNQRKILEGYREIYRNVVENPVTSKHGDLTMDFAITPESNWDTMVFALNGPTEGSMVRLKFCGDAIEVSIYDEREGKKMGRRWYVAGDALSEWIDSNCSVCLDKSSGGNK